MCDLNQNNCCKNCTFLIKFDGGETKIFGQNGKLKEPYLNVHGVNLTGQYRRFMNTLIALPRELLFLKYNQNLFCKNFLL